MYIIVKVFLILFVIAALSLFAVDYYFFLVDRYCRFHIGRWKDYKTWAEAVYKINVKWSRKTPTVKITDNARYILLDMLRGKYRSYSIQSWQNAAVVLGLVEKGDFFNAKKSIEQFIDYNGEWKKPPVAVDSAMLAYAILKVADDSKQIKPAMDYMIKIIDENIDEKGLISYTKGKENTERYVDTLGLVCPFLTLYAKIYDQHYYEKIAFQQLNFYYEHGLLRETNLPNHAVDAESELPLGVYGWGRGVAWYVIGLMDSFLEIQSNDYKRKLKIWIEEAANSYLKYQQLDGGFGSIVQRESTYDSSATATLAWFYAKCSEVFECQEYKEVSRNCLEKLKEVTRISGKIDWCQGDTKGIGIFAQTYDIMPFAQGMALRAIEIQRRLEINGSEN